MKNFAPIVLFTYNRPLKTEQTINALIKNELASESVVFFYCDGPKDDATEEQLSKIADVRQIVRKNYSFKEVHIIESERNKGLANSIIGGVTDIINQYGKIIVLEDDIITSKGFLRFMNDALEFYQTEERVMHISGYMYPHSGKLPETFFFNVPYPGGGWATWERAWKHFNNDADYLYNFFEENNTWDDFNRFGGKYLQKQLYSNVNHRIETWFIKWHAVLVMLDGFTLYPSQSLTNNIGFDDTATHCTPMTKFDIDLLAEQIEIQNIPLMVSIKAKKIIIRFYQGRFYSVRHFLINNMPEWIKLSLKRIFQPK